jgi:uncharacterized protein YukE
VPRIPRIGLALAGVAALAALLMASSATGRSQAQPSNSQEPFISSKVAVVIGAKLTGNRGSWNGDEPITYSYQWLRCNKDAINCKAINGAHETTYTIVKADAGHTLRFQVSAKNAQGNATAQSNATGEVPSNPNAPAVITSPTISGSPVVGQRLTASNGTWQGTAPISYSYVWQTCNAAVTGCSGTGKTDQTYTVAASDVGKRIRVRVTAKNSAGNSTALSDTTDVVASGGGGGGGNAVNVKDVGPAGERLTVDRVVFNPNPVTTRNVPIRVTITVKDTKGRLVQGALVFFRSTPIVTSTPTDAPTGSDGTVSYSVQPRSDFPIKNGFSVQFFVKAYRQGDPTLSGISGTRLVQVATHKP